MSIRWIETDDKAGLRPAEPIVCPACMGEFILKHQRFPNRDEVPKMFIRATTIRPLSHNPSAWVNDMTFKCEGCDYCVSFGRPMTEERSVQTIARRGGQIAYLPKEEWEKNEILRERLKVYGYV